MARRQAPDAPLDHVEKQRVSRLCGAKARDSNIVSFPEPVGPIVRFQDASRNRRLMWPRQRPQPNAKPTTFLNLITNSMTNPTTTLPGNTPQFLFLRPTADSSERPTKLTRENLAVFGAEDNLAHGSHMCNHQKTYTSHSCEVPEPPAKLMRIGGFRLSLPLDENPNVRIDGETYPCTKCSCPNFISSVVTTICRCGHDYTDHAGTT
jgi:hypothetical protein